MSRIKSFDIVVNPVGSKFAKALQQAVASKVINPVYRRSAPKTVPATRTIMSRRGNVLRQGTEGYVRPHFNITPRSLNKIEQFQRFTQHGVSCPRYALSVQQAKQLECKTLFARTLVNSTNGRGIVEFDGSAGEYPQAPLYTEYIPKKTEFRFHVFGGEVIDVQQKRKKQGFDEDRNTRVRNLNNGYVYCRDGVVAPDGAAALAVSAVASCGYQYGAVDLIYNEKQNKCFVLEVNSRPGIMNSTSEAYANAIISHYGLTQK